jgi:tetratricopeptide (TPR) repeat protein
VEHARLGGALSRRVKPGSRPYRDRVRQRLIAAGMTGQQLVAQVAADLERCGMRPRQAWRCANELSQVAAADRFNETTGDPRAPMRGNRIGDYEKWPDGGVRPPVRALKVLAQVYGTEWVQLIDAGDLDRMPAGDKQAFLDDLDTFRREARQADGRGAEHRPYESGGVDVDSEESGKRLATTDGLAAVPALRTSSVDHDVSEERDFVQAGRDAIAAESEVPGLIFADRMELLRQSLDDALIDGAMAEASLDDWEQTVVRYGRATRDRSAGLVLGDLSNDLADLQRALQRYRSASSLRRLARVTAQMSGLMCLTFCKLDDRLAVRRWARTARIAASEAGDPETISWVLAQEAYGHYYAGDLREAVGMARNAQAVVPGVPYVGAALAAALEARAHAAMGERLETSAALGRAEDITARLDGDALIPSAFGYNEAQLRFHAGSAHTHLRDTRAALRAQDRALELCMPGDYTDWAMTRLDRAACLVFSGEITEALAYAADTLSALTEDRRSGIITRRGYQILAALPSAERKMPAVRDFRDLLMLSSNEK